MDEKVLTLNGALIIEQDVGRVDHAMSLRNLFPWVAISNRSYSRARFGIYIERWVLLNGNRTVVSR